MSSSGVAYVGPHKLEKPVSLFPGPMEYVRALGPVARAGYGWERAEPLPAGRGAAPVAEQQRDLTNLASVLVEEVIAAERDNIRSRMTAYVRHVRLF